MATLTVRNLADETVARLKERARQNNRSLEAEVRALLEDGARSLTHAEFVREARRIAAMTPDVPQTDSAELIREDRDR